MQKTSKTLIRRLSLISVFVLFAALSHAALIISSLDSNTTPSSQIAKIGDTIDFHLVALNASAVYTDWTVVTINAAADTIYISSPNMPATPPSGNYYVYDGQRTWEVTDPAYTVRMSQNTIVLTDTMLVSGTMNLVVDYYSVKNAKFTMAAASLSTGGTATTAIGSAITGLGTDEPFTGVYVGSFIVSESYQFNIVNGAVVGYFVNGGVGATNQPFISPETLSIDGIRPRVELANAHPNPYNPSKELFQLFYYLSENASTVLNIYKVGFPTPVVTKNLNGIAGYNSPVLWDGYSDAGDFQTDGNYTYTFDIVDSVGNVGDTYSGILKITSVEVETTIMTVDTEYHHTGSVEVAVQMYVDVQLTNATATNLAYLGFDPVVYNYDNDVDPTTFPYQLYPWVLLDVRIYDAFGAEVHVWEVDSFELTDTDVTYANPSSNDSDYLDVDYVWASIPPCGSAVAGSVYASGDDDLINDWDIVFGGGELSNDLLGNFWQTRGFTFISSEITPGTYVIAVKGVLVGKSVNLYGEGTADGSDECSDPAVDYSYSTNHVQPSFFLDESNGLLTDLRGYGLSSLDAQGNPDTASFVIEEEQIIVLPDTAPPVIVTNSEDPTDGTLIQANEIGPSNPIKVTLTDNGVGVGSPSLSTIVLKDTFGNNINGSVGWNAGSPTDTTWEVYYTPVSPITTAGDYTYTVTPIDASNNAGPPVVFSFTVEDTAAPIISNVKVRSNSGNTPVTLSLSTSSQVSFFADQIEATIITGGTSDVDWTNSSIVVIGSSSNTIAGTVSHEAGSNILSFKATSNMVDDSYEVQIIAVSVNTYQSNVVYDFFITTAGTTFVDTTGPIAAAGPNTYMIITETNVNDSGMVDSLGVDMDANSITVATITSPAVPSTYAVLGNVVQFDVMALLALPVYIDNTLTTATLRMHYSDADITTLNGLGLSESDLTLWVWDGVSTWTQLPPASVSSPVSDGTDNYIQYSPITQISSGNAYALMYESPAVPVSAVAAFKFESTKGFNPTNGPAKIYYTDDFTSVDKVNIKIYSLSGTIVRTSKFDSSKITLDNLLFTSFDTNPLDGTDTKYYYSWDGKNDTYATVRNGMYIMKIEIILKTGEKSIITRMVALVK